VLSVEEFLPAVGQGAIGIETRADDAKTRGLLAAINHTDTQSALACERGFLAVLDGSCKTPIGGYATVSGGRLRFRGMAVTPDGSEAFETTREGETRDAEKIGSEAGRDLKDRAGPDFFSKL
jgi:hydroxymethylbilane synthase